MNSSIKNCCLIPLICITYLTATIFCFIDIKKSEKCEQILELVLQQEKSQNTIQTQTSKSLPWPTAAQLIINSYANMKNEYFFVQKYT